jgi:hypothetical protein
VTDKGENAGMEKGSVPPDLEALLNELAWTPEIDFELFQRKANTDA